MQLLLLLVAAVEQYTRVPPRAMLQLFLFRAAPVSEPNNSSIPPRP